jgi:hypothetical protein
MKPLQLDLLPREAWRPMPVAEGRRLPRIHERELETAAARLEIGGNKAETIDITLWDFSCQGFAVLISTRDWERLGLARGREVRLLLPAPDEELAFECRIENHGPCQGRIRAGLSRQDWTVSVFDAETLALPAAAQLGAETQHPLLFDAWIEMRLIGLAHGLRLIFASDDESLLACVGQALTLHMALPTADHRAYAGRIYRIECVEDHQKADDGRLGATQADTTPRLRLALQPLSLSSDWANDLGEWLASEGGIPPETLRAFGFPLRFFRHSTTTSFVDGQEDYESVLNLRRMAYVEAGKKAETTTAEEMSSSWDKRSRILCMHYEGELVASATLTFPDRLSAPLRSQSAFPGGNYPCPMPDPLECIEISGLCTHRDYRKGDLLSTVFEQVARVFLLSGRKHIVTLADDHLLPLYLKLGFRDRRQTCTYLNRRHHLISIARDTIITGSNCNWLVWQRLFGDLIADLKFRGLLEAPRRGRMRLKCLLALRPLAKGLIRKKIAAEFRRKITIKP